MKTEVKISVEGLRTGMFVARLDRSWLETPFAFQGMEIRTPEDIEQIRACCNYVFVDVEQGVAPDARYWILSAGPKRQEFLRQPQARDAEAQEYNRLRRRKYEDSTDFRSELGAAQEASAGLQEEYDRFIADLRRGRELDLAVVKRAVAETVKSVVRNPSAMLWVAQVKKLDEHSYSRALGTAVWCATFGRHLGVAAAAIQELALGGLLLDVGKSRMPSELLQKKGDLQEKELRVLQSHVNLGVKLLSALSAKDPQQRLPLTVRQMVATHHERADGSGYPQGIENQQIPLFGRIAGIVDTYDAITSERPYGAVRDPRTPHEAIQELYALRNTKFQAELVEQMIQAVGLYPTGSLVELSSGEVAVVVASHGMRRLRPSVMLLLDKNKKPLPEFESVDLAQKPQGPTVARALPAGSYGINMKELFLL